MVNVREEFTDVAFQDPTGAGVVMPRFVCEGAKSVQGLVGALAFPAGEGIGNKLAVEIRIEDAVDGVVEEAVADGGLADVAGFRVGNPKGLIASVAVGMMKKLATEKEYIISEVKRELLNIGLAALPAQEFLP